MRMLMLMLSLLLIYFGVTLLYKHVTYRPVLRVLKKNGSLIRVYARGLITPRSFKVEQTFTEALPKVYVCMHKEDLKAHLILVSITSGDTEIASVLKMFYKEKYNEKM